MIDEMGAGFHEGLMEAAVSKAFSVPLRDIQMASMLTGDISEVAYLCRKYGRGGYFKSRF